MIALRFVRLIETHSDELTAGLISKFRTSSRTADLDKVPPTNYAIAPERSFSISAIGFSTRPKPTSNTGTARSAPGGLLKVFLYQICAGRSSPPKNTFGVSCKAGDCLTV